ncbi:YdaU family protein [Hansschlegelia zhihuaiae]|nr:DUF1376 domain-containing protein [Hansschlegelia zhihuaiae]
MPLYVGDYLRDTRALTAEQHGAYLLLLMSMWNAGGELPADDRRLARFASCSPSRWAKIKAEILGFFDVQGGVVKHKRLGAELEKAQEKSFKRADSGTRGGYAKALKDKEARMANAMPLPCHSSEPDKEREDPAPPPDGGVAHPPKPEAAPSPASSLIGGSLSPRGTPARDRVGAAVKRAEAEAVLADPLASAEERFWAMKFRLLDRGVSWGLAVKLSKLHQARGEGFAATTSAVEKALKARGPTSYLGKIVSELKREIEGDGALPQPSDGKRDNAPAWVKQAWDDGLAVIPDGPGRWSAQGVIYDDEQNEVAW